MEKIKLRILFPRTDDLKGTADPLITHWIVDAFDKPINYGHWHIACFSDGK